MSGVEYHRLSPPARILLGAGPNNIHPRVQAALSAPLVGHLDPYFQSLMDETVSLLRYAFQTENKLTFPISGTGSAGMEAAFDNFLEPGDVAVIGVSGIFGERMADNARRTGATVIPVQAEWGDIVEPDAVKAVLNAYSKVKLISLVHVETSTGVLQPLEDIARLAREHDALFLVDAVTSLGGVELPVDKLGIDICYSCSQKCIGTPPGLAPFTANEKALAALKKRAAPVHSWYLDLALLSSYWVTGRVYHHTAPVSMIYAIHEALGLIMEEGLTARIERHVRNGEALQRGILEMGLEIFAKEPHRARSLTTVRIPPEVNGARVVQRLLNEYNIEISSGLGPLRGKVWRLGVMGYSSTQENIVLVLSALENILRDEGFRLEQGAGTTAAVSRFNSA